MDLGHRHGDAAAQASESQQALRDIRAQAYGPVGIAGARRVEGRLVEGGPPLQNQRERQHRRQAE